MKKSFVFLLGFAAGGVSIVSTFLFAVLWFCCPAANPGFANLLLFHPMKQFDELGGREIMGVKATEVSFKAEPGVELNGRLYNQKGARQVVLYNHGNGGNISMPYVLYKVNSLLSTGASVLAYDYRGFGKSTGSPTVDGVVADSKAAYDYLLKNTKFTKDQIIVYGESLGTGVSSALVQQVDCGAVVLDSGFISPEVIGKEKFELFRLYPSSMFPNQFDVLKLVAGKHPPILIVAGKLDEVISSHHSQYLFDHASKPTQLTLFDKCDHAFFQAQQGEFDQRLKTFFNDCAGTVSTGQYALLK